MKKGNHIWQKSFVGLSALVVVSSLSVTSAFADDSTSSSTGSVTTTVATTNPFTTKYDSNLAQESALLTQAQAGNTQGNAQVAALISTAQTLNTQTAALYTSEQALFAAESSIPQVSVNSTAGQLTQLENERTDILAKSLKDWEWLLQFVHNPHDHGKLNQALHAHKGILNQLSDVNAKIADLKGKHHGDEQDRPDGKHPYNNGLSQLQQSITSLQGSSMKYTQTAILLEQSLAASTSTTGSTYGSSAGTNGSNNGGDFAFFGNFDF